MIMMMMMMMKKKGKYCDNEIATQTCSYTLILYQ
jgi:hypothetical protein